MGTDTYPALVIRAPEIHCALQRSYVIASHEIGKTAPRSDFWGLILGVALSPRVAGQLRQRYPTAKHLWLLSIGMTVILLGVTLRMAFPTWQGAGFDLSWLGIAFFSILLFVLINRGNKDVLQ